MRKPISEWLKEMPQDRQEIYMMELTQTVSNVVPEEVREIFTEQFLSSEEESMIGVVSCHHNFEEDSFKDWEEYLIGYYGSAEKFQLEAEKEFLKVMYEMMDVIGDLPDIDELSED